MALKYRAPPAWCLTIPLRATVWQNAKCTRSAERAHTLRKDSQSHQQAPELAEIELRNVTLSYNRRVVLDDLSLSIKRGESTAIIGTSGTGKSTTLRVISGLELPDSGEVFLRGWKRKRTLARERGNLRVSMVFQNAALFDSLSVYENVGFRLLQQGKLSQERIYELVKQFLRRVDMEDAIEKYPEQLSGGMQKRVSLARAIIYDPEDTDSAPDILLYDEPTAGLDPTASTRIENIIRNVQDVCPTCIVVTHQFSTIRRTADRVILMHEGKVVWDGRVEELDTTDNPFVLQFMSASLDGPLNSDQFSELEKGGP
ncbi:ABC transporter [Gracilaria domingensis]|nr:ABC transporter [Gracilaria domingensis]